MRAGVRINKNIRRVEKLPQATVWFQSPDKTRAMRMWQSGFPVDGQGDGHRVSGLESARLATASP